MYLNFHTHFPSKNSNSINIYNVIVNNEAMDANSWLEMEAVSLGIHPWYISKENVTSGLDYIREHATRPNVKLIGEMGLDKVHGADWSMQEEVFMQQLEIAEEVKKPMVVHCVRAFNELVIIKKTRKPKMAIVIHGFARKASIAHELIGHGFKLSFGKDLLNKTRVKTAFLEIPLKSVFLETDDMEDLEIEDVYAAAAKIKNISLTDLKENIYQNYLEL